MGLVTATTKNIYEKLDRYEILLLYKLFVVDEILQYDELNSIRIKFKIWLRNTQKENSFTPSVISNLKK